MSVPGRLGITIRWLVVGTLLTLLLFLPVFFALGYWFNSLDYVTPVAASLAIALMLLVKWLASRP